MNLAVFVAARGLHGRMTLVCTFIHVQSRICSSGRVSLMMAIRYSFKADPPPWLRVETEGGTGSCIVFRQTERPLYLPTNGGLTQRHRKANAQLADGYTKGHRARSGPHISAGGDPEEAGGESGVRQRNALIS